MLDGQLAGSIEPQLQAVLLPLPVLVVIRTSLVAKHVLHGILHPRSIAQNGHASIDEARARSARLQAAAPPSQRLARSQDELGAIAASRHQLFYAYRAIDDLHISVEVGCDFHPARKRVQKKEKALLVLLSIEIERCT